MTVEVTNAQRAIPVSTSALARLAQRAIRRLRIRTPGRLAITFVDPRRMRLLNRQFLGHDWTTDVLAFRYDGEPSCLPRRIPRSRSVVGELLIAPSAARRYAREHRLDYTEELSRYVVHGLLHWLGQDDQTARQQRRMRGMEDDVLQSCGPKPRGLKRP